MYIYPFTIMLNTTGMGGKAKQKKTTLFTSTEPLEHMLPFSLTGAHAISLLSHHHPQGKASFFPLSKRQRCKRVSQPQNPHILDQIILLNFTPCKGTSRTSDHKPPPGPRTTFQNRSVRQGGSHLWAPLPERLAEGSPKARSSSPA